MRYIVLVLTHDGLPVRAMGPFSYTHALSVAKAGRVEHATQAYPSRFEVTTLTVE